MWVFIDRLLTYRTGVWARLLPIPTIYSHANIIFMLTDDIVQYSNYLTPSTSCFV